jgi:hypothetical protein
MVSEIERTILALIEDNIEAVRASGVQKDARRLLAPVAVAVAVLDGKFEKVGQASFRQDITISILVKFKNMQSEAARRNGINPIVQAIVQLLALNRLDLEIKPLVPVRFRDVTTEEKYAGGVIEYLVEFATSFSIEKQSTEIATDLLKVGLNYLLTPGDAVADATDTITLQGGTP